MRKLFLTIALIVSVFGLSAQDFTPMPYISGFETEADTVGWRFASRSKGTPFVIGIAAHRMGNYGLYLSYDDGVNLGYKSNKLGGYNSVAYRKFTFELGEYDFHYDLRMTGGEVMDSFMVAMIPVLNPSTGQEQTPTATASGSSFQKLGWTNALADSKGRKVIGTLAWETMKYTLDVKVEGEYWIAFYFKEKPCENDGQFRVEGSVIDNMQIHRKKALTDCAHMPTEVKVDKGATDYTVSWAGNADSYDLQYYTTHDPKINEIVEIKGIKGKSYRIPITDLPEGNYSFRVRGRCANDSSLWASYNNVMVYDPSLHCIDYIDLKGADVRCTKGNYADPYMEEGVVDNGYLSKESMHTVHYMGDEYDRLTGYQLKTVPDGAVASVRLSNWKEQKNSPVSESGSITYNWKVTEDNDVLLIKYAAVLQYEKTHDESQQTEITVEILNRRGELLNSCTQSVFNAKQVDKDKLRSWHTYYPKIGELNDPIPVKWSDWLTLGINLSEHVGQEVKIRITTRACGFDWHFAYCYFTIDCAAGELEGMSCNSIPTHFTAPEGFDYLWYRQDDLEKKDTVSTERVFNLKTGDTNSYFVDCISKYNPNCHFTLAAYTTPIVPRAYADFRHIPSECRNRVQLLDTSGVYKLGSGMADENMGIEVDSVRWDLGEWASATDENMVVTVPNEGAAVKFKITAYYTGCDHTGEFEFLIPPIGESRDTVEYTVCEGERVTVNDEEYDRTGTYEQMFKNRVGCDSILTVNIYPNDASLITQRWNDVLGVMKTTKYGDSFTDYQWMVDGTPIEGQTGAIYYAGEGRVLDVGAVYSVTVVTADGDTIESCPFRPTKFDDGVEVGTVTFAGGTVEVTTPESAVAELYSTAGVKLAAQRLTAGGNIVTMPASPGVYMLVITHPDGQRRLYKVVVR